MLQDEIGLRVRAFEKPCKILELAAVLAFEDARAARALQRLHDDRKPQFAFDEADVHRKRAEDRARDREARPDQELERVELVGNALDGGGTVDEAHATPLEMPEQGKREIVGLRARAADDEVGPRQRAVLILCRPVVVCADDKLELVGMQDLEVHIHRVGGFLEAEDLRHFRQRGIEFTMEENPASHIFP